MAAIVSRVGAEPRDGICDKNLSRLGLRWWLWDTSCVIGSTALVGEYWGLSGNHLDVWKTCNGAEGAVRKPMLATVREEECRIALCRCMV